jgi:hypothetical protein
MKTLLTNWNFMRGLRLALGIYILVHAITQGDIAIGLLSAFVVFTALANVGCCGSRGCAVDYKTKSTEKEISYEEVDAK